jgi:uncharacterized protein with NAD-binding domain and iron-sulfur cluster
MNSAPTLTRLVHAMDRALMPDASTLSLSTVCLDIEADTSIQDMDQSEAREIMAEIDAKSSALLAVLAIILAVSAFLFSHEIHPVLAEGSPRDRGVASTRSPRR